MPIDASPDVPLLSRLDTALLRRTAAALVARSGEYGDLFVEEVRQAEILRDGLEPGAVVTGGGRGAAVRVLSPLGQRHTAVDGLDPDRIARLPRLVRERGDAAVPTAKAAWPAPAGNQSSFPEPAPVEALAVYLNAVAGAIPCRRSVCAPSCASSVSRSHRRKGTWSRIDAPGRDSPCASRCRDGEGGSWRPRPEVEPAIRAGSRRSGRRFRSRRSCAGRSTRRSMRLRLRPASCRSSSVLESGAFSSTRRAATGSRGTGRCAGGRRSPTFSAKRSARRRSPWSTIRRSMACPARAGSFPTRPRGSRCSSRARP